MNMGDLRNIIAGLIALSLATACQESATPTGKNTAVTAKQLANATYEGIYDGPVTLKDGEYLGKPFVEGGAARPRVQLVTDFLIRGDIDGDGSDEAVVLLAESSGGSGTFVYVAVVGLQDGQLASIGTAPLGDRVQVKQSDIRAGIVSMDVVQAGPDDPACCPSENATRTWRLDGGSLVEQEAQMTGELSVADLEGQEWVLVQFGDGHDAPPEPELTLVFDNGRVAGHAGCNRYMGGVEAGVSGGDIKFGPLAGTMMACPQDLMDLERRYLKALNGVRKFGFLAGRLALSTVDDEGQLSTLIFEGRAPRM
ncbi:MAG: META domain-containing protein [Gammaproteobacteria bacterium]